MNKVTLAAAAATTLMVVSAPIAFADSNDNGAKEDLGLGFGIGKFLQLGGPHESANADVHANVNAAFKTDKHDRGDNDNDADHGHATSTPNTVSIAGKVTAKAGTALTVAGNDGTTYNVDGATAKVKGESFADIAVGDTVVVNGTLNGTALTAKTVLDTTSLRVKVQNALSHVTGGIVTAVNGATFSIDNLLNPTTTVVTNSNTVVKGKDGATTTAALQVGQRVIVVGTTTATSTSGDTFTASIVKILGNGLHNLRLWFGLGL